VTIHGVWIGGGFIDHLYTQLGTTSNYIATANLHASQIITKHTKSFAACCVVTSRSWQLLLTVEILQLHALRFYLHSLHCRTKLSSLCLLLIISRHEPHRKHRSPIVVFVSVAAGTCLQSRFLETDTARTTEITVLLLLRVCMLRALLSNGRCLQSHCLATGLYATI
jgi:hypothetical protein